MTIKKIIIEKLFNTFTHEIRFNVNGNITIIMGENGVGKTVSLQLINAIFTQKFSYLFDIEFSNIVITFHKETWHITKSIDNKKDFVEYKISIKSSRKNTEIFEITTDKLFPRIPPYIMRISEDSWLNRHSGNVMTRKELYERYESQSVEVPQWYLHQCGQNRIKFIQTQRLLQRREENNRQVSLAVEEYSKELSALMQEEISRVAKGTGDLDRTFPKRLLNQIRSNHRYQVSEISNELHKLEKQRLELSSLGLLTETEASDTIIPNLNENNDTILSVLNLYIKDSWQKLQQYQKLYNKLTLLKDIINSRFKHKSFTVDSSRGFVITPDAEDDKCSADKQKEISVNLLSSGEQNELVLFYELLFKCDEKDLILIDEPEISLHLDWLQNMIEDIKKITRNNNSSLLIATHSPDFVGNNYDLVQNLE